MYNYLLINAYKKGEKMNKYFLLVPLIAFVSSIKAPPSIGEMAARGRDEGPVAGRDPEEARKAEEERHRREAEEARLRALDSQGKSGGSKGGPVDTSGQRRTPTDTVGSPKDPVSDTAARDLAASRRMDTASDFSLPDVSFVRKKVQTQPVLMKDVVHTFYRQKAEYHKSLRSLENVFDIGVLKQFKEQQTLFESAVALRERVGGETLSKNKKYTKEFDSLVSTLDGATGVNRVLDGAQADDIVVNFEGGALKLIDTSKKTNNIVVVKNMMSLAFVHPEIRRAIIESMKDAKAEEEQTVPVEAPSRVEERGSESWYTDVGMEVPRAVVYDRVGVSRKLVELKKTPQGQKELLRIANRIKQNKEGGLAPLFKKLDQNAENYIMRNLDHLTEQLNSGGIKLQV